MEGWKLTFIWVFLHFGSFNYIFIFSQRLQVSVLHIKNLLMAICSNAIIQTHKLCQFWQLFCFQSALGSVLSALYMTETHYCWLDWCGCWTQDSLLWCMLISLTLTVSLLCTRSLASFRTNVITTQETIVFECRTCDALCLVCEFSRIFTVTWHSSHITILALVHVLIICRMPCMLYLS